MKNINIPEPCSENWNEMTPTQKGAFCQKCALDVFDFTNKSGSEIRTILAQNIGSRVCGRIENVQLAELNSDFEAWKINNSRSYQRAWIFTLFVVFGLTLFSCEEENIAEKMQRVGQQILKEQVAEFQERSVTKGAMVSSDHVGVEPAPKAIPPEEIEHPMLGEMVYEGREVELEETVILEEVVLPAIERYDIAGGMIASYDYQEYLQESVPTEVESVLSGLMYPNPATNESTLKLQMPDNGKVEINLYSLNGQHLREIHSGRVSKGETEFGIDLTDLETGMYMVVIVSDKQKETVKFTKV